MPVYPDAPDLHVQDYNIWRCLLHTHQGYRRVTLIRLMNRMQLDGDSAPRDQINTAIRHIIANSYW